MIADLDQMGRDEDFRVGAQRGGHPLEECDVTGRVGRRGEQQPPRHRGELTDTARTVARVRARTGATWAGDRESTAELAAIDRPHVDRRELPEWGEPRRTHAGDHDHQGSLGCVGGDEGQNLGGGLIQPVGIVDGGADGLRLGDAAEQLEHSGRDHPNARPGLVDQAECGLQCREMSARKERATLKQLTTEQMQRCEGDLLLGSDRPNPEYAEIGSLVDQLVQGCRAAVSDDAHPTAATGGRTPPQLFEPELVRPVERRSRACRQTLGVWVNVHRAILRAVGRIAPRVRHRSYPRTWQPSPGDAREQDNMPERCGRPRC
ncbi:hypothetical protein AB0877_11965 [Micromonospora sp. NPDC047644]|uniref:hypothetical protein n=1 Tax=Micromonospora sp. NPDC047644 TaxID=3157203 RepID=UPI003452091D